MLQIVIAIAITGTAVLLPGHPAWAGHGAPYAGNAGPVDTPAPEPTRCGPGADTAGTDNDLAALTLPNAYMTVNGRVFTLGRAIACAARLHTARYH